jgi:SAM-dependent methyltransferase
VNDNNLEEQIAAATAYEELHVPALFQQWPEPLLDALQVQAGDRVLDVACGTGILARTAAQRVGSQGRVAGLDPGSGMLHVAAQLAPDVEWRQGVAESMPFADESFEGVGSQFGMMFFTDRQQAIREMLRVLAPSGRLAVAVWDSLENSEAYPEEVALLQRIAGPRAADALRAPFVLGDPQELAGLFEGAGVADLQVTKRTGKARFPSIRSMVEADLRGWLPVMGVELPEEQIDRILAEAETTLRRYVTTEGKVVFDAPAHIVTGTRQ